MYMQFCTRLFSRELIRTTEPQVLAVICILCILSRGGRLYLFSCRAIRHTLGCVGLSLVCALLQAYSVTCGRTRPDPKPSLSSPSAHGDTITDHRIAQALKRRLLWLDSYVPSCAAVTSMSPHRNANIILGIMKLQQ